MKDNYCPIMVPLHLEGSSENQDFLRRSDCSELPFTMDCDKLYFETYINNQQHY